MRGGLATPATARRLERAGLIIIHDTPLHPRISFTPQGEKAASEVVRRHRLWEYYLIRRADFDEDHVDRGADDLEHLLPLGLLDELEKELQAERGAIPPSPHSLTIPARKTEGIT